MKRIGRKKQFHIKKQLVYMLLYVINYTEEEKKDLYDY